MVCSVVLLACAEGFSAARVGEADSSQSATFRPALAGNAALGGASGGVTATTRPPVSGTSGSSGTPAPTPTAGSAAEARCQNLACENVFDCVFRHLGNNCGFRSCEAGFCR
jgi:hypothetical protein